MAGRHARRRKAPAETATPRRVRAATGTRFAPRVQRGPSSLHASNLGRSAYLRVEAAPSPPSRQSTGAGVPAMSSRSTRRRAFWRLWSLAVAIAAGLAVAVDGNAAAFVPTDDATVLERLP